MDEVRRGPWWTVPFLHIGKIRNIERWFSFSFPMLFSGRAILRESYDDDAQLYRINLEVRNPVFGFLFGYSGSFTCEFPLADGAPTRLKPIRHETRE